MSQIHIIDGQESLILDYITADNIISDNHKKSLEDTLETYDFITFADKRFSEHLEKRNRIIIPDEDGSLVEFVIFEAAKYKDTEGYKAQVFANASYLELRKTNVIYPDTYQGTASQLLGMALNGTGRTVGRVEAEGTRTIRIEQHTSPYDFVKRIAKEFECELAFPIEHDGTKVTARYVELLERVGDWRGREVEFGRDLDGIRRVEKQDIVTALLGLGPEREDGTRLEVLVEDFDALQRWGWYDEYGNLNHLIEAYEIESSRSEMTDAEARQYTRTALNKRINTQITYETTIIDLENVPGMANKKIRFGDTIKIKDTTFNPPLYLEARVFEQTRSIKTTAKKEIKLGDFIEYTEEEVHEIWKQLQKEIKNRVSHYEMVEYTYDKLTIDDKDETVFEDGKTFAEATGITAEENAKAFAVEEDKKIKVDVEDYADRVSEQQANSALEQAKMYSVAKEVYENQMNQIAQDMADKADLVYVDGQLVSKANKGDVYTIEDVDNMINNTVSKTQYETDMDGIVTQLESHGTRIGQNEHTIGLKADASYVDSVENELTRKIGNVEVTAEGASITASEVRADLDGLEIGGRNLITLDSVLRSGAVVDGHKFTLTRSGTGNPYVRIPHTLFENSTDYVITFKVRKISGTVHSMAGHVESISVASSTVILRDGEVISDGTSWSTGDRNGYPDDTQTHKYEIRFTTSSDVSRGTTPYWYIQPNRSAYGQDYKLEIWDWQLEKGNKATDWSPAPEDTDEAIEQVSGRVETLDGEIKTVAGEVALKASQSVVDSLEGRVSTAEGELRVLPGQIEAKVDEGEARSIFLQEASSFTFDADQIIFDGHVFGGNATFTGDISGATITGSEIVSVGDTGRITMDNANLYGQWYYSFSNVNYTFNLTPFELSLVEYRGNNTSPNNMIGRTDIGSLGVFFDRGNGGTGSITFQGYQGSNADETVMTLSADTVRSDSFAAIGMGVSRGFKFPNDHVISTGTNLHFTIFGNRTGGGYPFRVRSHVNYASYRDDFWIDTDGMFYSAPLYNNTSSNASNARVSYASGDQKKGTIYRSVSAKKYKTDIQTVTDVDYYKILELNLRSWLDKGDIERNGGSTDGVKRNYGLIADEVAEVGLPQYVDYMEGEIEGLAYDRLMTLLIPITKDHEIKINAQEIKLSMHERKIISLENKVEILENEIKELKGVV